LEKFLPFHSSEFVVSIVWRTALGRYVSPNSRLALSPKIFLLASAEITLRY
jgi:hypothetical protein